MDINLDTIIKDHDATIRNKSQPVDLPLSMQDKATLMALYNYVKDSINPKVAEEKKLKPAVGIAAIQAGIPKQLCAIICEDERSTEETNIWHHYALANAKIISYSAKKSYLKHGEGCLSVEEDHSGYVMRSARIKVQAYDLLQNKEVLIRASGYLAIVLQHEIDHFQGILFYDYINKLDPYHASSDALIIE